MLDIALQKMLEARALKKILLICLLLGAVLFFAGGRYFAWVNKEEQTQTHKVPAAGVTITEADSASLISNANSIIKLCSKLSEEETYGDDNSFKYIIAGKDGWIFRSEMDLKEDIKLSNWSRTSFGRLQKAFEHNGTTLAVMVIPTRGIVGYPHLLPDNSEKYDQVAAQEGYIGLLDDLEGVGYIVADMRDVDGQKNFFLKRDNHWTAEGAKYAAKRMANAIKTKPLYKDLRKAKYKTVTLKVTKDDEANDRFLQFIDRICGKKPPEETLPAIYSTALVDDGKVENALFEETSQPEIVLLGTSNSTSLEPSYANFAGFLREYLSTDIKNEAVPGGAFRGSIGNYVLMDRYKKAKPKIIIWELSAHYGFDQKATFREVIPALYGACKDKDAVILSKGKLKPGRNYVFDNIDVKDLFSSDYYLYLEFKNKDLRKFKVDFMHYDKHKDKFRFKRTKKNFPKNNGKFFVELKSGIHKSLKTVVVTVKEKSAGSYIAKMCKIPDYMAL